MKKQSTGFSLVEVAIVLVIIGVVMAAIAIGKDVKTNADVTRLFKNRVESCIMASFQINSHKKYDGSEIDKHQDNGTLLKHFCKIKKHPDGKITARIYVPSEAMAVLLYEKSQEILSPDDFKVMPHPPTNRNLLIVTNDGYGVIPPPVLDTGLGGPTPGGSGGPILGGPAPGGLTRDVFTRR